AGLIKSLDSDSYLERQRAQEYLEEMVPKVLPALRKALETTGDAEVRRRARHAVEKIEVIDHFDRLVKDLKDDNRRVREAARDGLVKFGSGALSELNKIADSTDDLDVFLQSRKAIREIRKNDPMLRDKPDREFDKDAAAELVKRLGSKSPIDRLRAFEYLSDMGSKVLPLLEKEAKANPALKDAATKLAAVIRANEEDAIELVPNNQNNQNIQKLQNLQNLQGPIQRRKQ
ncbi:MAG: HEAT repeat domain-containing protein, partial [Cyanobacteria bacterium]|nr:HEAT repeat domain-containing protein [Cyanobacteriota bacterium]